MNPILLSARAVQLPATFPVRASWGYPRKEIEVSTEPMHTSSKPRSYDAAIMAREARLPRLLPEHDLLGFLVF